MNVAILLLNSGRGSGEVARQQARYLASKGCRVFFMHPGLLTKRGPQLLGRAIRGLLSDPEKLELMARAGRRRAEQNFSWLKLGRRLQDWLVRLSSS
jgi:glycosyltransferase involved in cell wall biosynthesis